MLFDVLEARHRVAVHRAIQLCLGIWLIAKGFKPSPLHSEDASSGLQTVGMTPSRMGNTGATQPTETGRKSEPSERPASA